MSLPEGGDGVDMGGTVVLLMWSGSVPLVLPGTIQGHHITTPYATEHPIAKVTKTTTLPCSGGSTEMPPPAGTPATSTYDD